MSFTIMCSYHHESVATQETQRLDPHYKPKRVSTIRNACNRVLHLSTHGKHALFSSLRIVLVLDVE